MVCDVYKFFHLGRVDLFVFAGNLNRSINIETRRKRAFKLITSECERTWKLWRSLPGSWLLQRAAISTVGRPSSPRTYLQDWLWGRGSPARTWICNVHRPVRKKSVVRKRSYTKKTKAVFYTFGHLKYFWPSKHIWSFYLWTHKNKIALLTSQSISIALILLLICDCFSMYKGLIMFRFSFSL